MAKRKTFGSSGITHSMEEKTSRESIRLNIREAKSGMKRGLCTFAMYRLMGAQHSIGAAFAHNKSGSTYAREDLRKLHDQVSRLAERFESKCILPKYRLVEPKRPRR